MLQSERTIVASSILSYIQWSQSTSVQQSHNSDIQHSHYRKQHGDFSKKKKKKKNKLKIELLSCFCSVAKSCPLLCNPVDCITPGLPVPHHLVEFTQVRVHQADDAIQPSHPLSFPSPAFNLSQHQSLFQWVSSSHQVAKVLKLQLQHQTFQCVVRVYFL